MTTVIPGVITTYEDGHAPTALNTNDAIQLKIGAAGGGVPGRIYSFDSTDGKEQAKLIFRSGPLLKSILEAFNAGSERILAVRIGASVSATANLLNATPGGPAPATLTFNDPGVKGNDWKYTLVSAGPSGNFTLWDDSLTYPTLYTYTGLTSLAALVAAVNAETSVHGISAVQNNSDPTMDASSVAFTGGNDGLVLTNLMYTNALEASRSRKDINYVHCVGWTSLAGHLVVLEHCDEMLDTFQSERYAVLEYPLLDSTNTIGSAAYLTDVSDYVTDFQTHMGSIGNRNGIIAIGGLHCLDEDGNDYIAPYAGPLSGLIAKYRVQESLINKVIGGARSDPALTDDPGQGCVPLFSPSQLEDIINARGNAATYTPGLGFHSVESLTTAAATSDYTDINTLRPVYKAGNVTRRAMLPLAGDENDEAGEGLKQVEKVCRIQLDKMVAAGEIDNYTITITSNAADRLLGNVRITLGILVVRTMKHLLHNVYVQPPTD